MLQDGLTKVISGDTTFEEILKLIDLDDDLGTETAIGLHNALEDSNKANITETLETL